MRNQRTWLRAALAVLLVAGLLLSAGCGKNPEGTQDPVADTHQSASKPESDQEDGKTEQPALTPEELAAAALDSLRRDMAGTPQVLAAAYFGYFDYTEEDPYAFMGKQSPRLCHELPFLTMIPEERIAGHYYGELYAVVPADPKACITVRAWGINENEEEVYEEVVYQQESGEPFLLFCNPAWSPDAQVIITGSDGSTVVWYPMLDKFKCVAQLLNENDDGMILDISSYAETLTVDYFAMLDDADWPWHFPTREDLIDTAWSWEGYPDADTYVTYEIIFREEVADIRWNDGIDKEDHAYSGAPWELTYEEGLAVLSIDFGRFAGVLRYDLLIDAEYGILYTMVDVSSGHVDTGLEALYRFLTKEPLNVP